MRYLLYCIFSKSARQPTVGLRGVDLQPVLEITSNELSAAVSQMDRMPAPHDVPQVLIYERVIATLHREHTLIPMRFGCLLDGPSGVIELLEERGSAFKDTLAAMMDCVETGIHVLFEKRAMAGETPLAPGTRATASANDSSRNGLAYLVARRQYYDRIDRDTQDHQQIMEQFCSDFAGLFVRCKVDDHSRGLPFAPCGIRMVSFRFLVHRSFLREFCSAAERVIARMDEDSFLSDPCPPYSFTECQAGAL